MYSLAQAQACSQIVKQLEGQAEFDSGGIMAKLSHRLVHLLC